MPRRKACSTTRRQRCFVLDTKHDAGDFDPGLQTVAKADRLMVLCNRVAAAVSPKYPDVYREKPSVNIAAEPQPNV